VSACDCDLSVDLTTISPTKRSRLCHILRETVRGLEVWVGPRNHVLVGGARISRGRGTFSEEGENFPAIVNMEYPS